MVNGTRQSGPENSGLEEIVPRRKQSGPAKKLVLLALWLALLAGLIYWIKTAGGNGGAALPGVTAPKPVPAPVLSTAMLETRWPEIAAHAAAPARGAAGARYTLAEFGDFQCPMCGKAYPVLESLLKKYPKQVNLLFLHRPFPTIHKWALAASQASEIAAKQGKFWPMYDVLYTHQDNLEPGYYSGYAAQAGLNPAKFTAAFNAGVGQSQVQTDSAFADSVGIQETPTILLRDNTAKTVTIYVGTKGSHNTDGTLQYPGLLSLASNPPWAGK